MAKLNETLAKTQKITQQQRDNLDKLYTEIETLFNKEKKDKNINETGEQYVKKLKELEFKLQENWNFSQDELFHTWWNKFSNCTCPDYDNRERFGYPKIINTDCPLHKHLIK